MKDQDSKITIKKHVAEQFTLPIDDLIKLPPNWKVVDKNNNFLYYDESGDLALENKNDNNSSRRFCWAIYNRIDN